MKNLTKTVPRPILDNYARLNACAEIPKGKIKDDQLITLQGIRIVITSSISSQKAGIINASGYQAIPISLYNLENSRPAVSYSEHSYQVLANNRPRGYAGIKVNHSSGVYVLIDPKHTFLPEESGIQINLF